MESNFELEQINSFSFASRKFPEYMFHRYIRCGQCHALFASPVPELTELQNLYDDADFDSGEESNYAAETYLNVLIKKGPSSYPLSDVLDIGASDGKFLYELKKNGFDKLIGIEPSRKPIEHAPSGIRELIIHNIFHKDLFSPESFSLVTCFQTMEHVPDPCDLAQNVFKVLKPGGVFFIISHDYTSLCNKILGKKSPIYDIEHLQIFCPAAMRYLLEEVGYQHVFIFPVLNTYPLSYWIKLAPLGHHIKHKLIDYVQKSRLRHITLSLPVGNMAIFGIKNDS